MNKLVTYLQSLKLKNTDGTEILSESQHYKVFYDFIHIFCNDKKITILYRGSNPSDVFLSNIFNTKDFARKMFMLGEKSHHFESGHKALICVDDCSDEVFEYIFERFQDKICQLNFQNETTKKVVEKFLEANPSIKSYFSDISNKERFISKTYNQKKAQKKRIMDYYFSLLHTIGKSAYGDSYFISTSKSLDIAKQFQNDGIILVTWVPDSEKDRQIIRFEDVNKSNKVIQKLGLPMWDASPYVEQEEVCVKGGLLPHYIVGYSYGDSFVVHPSLLTQLLIKDDINLLLKDGIDVDQTLFDNEIKKTKYRGGFLCLDGEISEIKD